MINNNHGSNRIFFILPEHDRHSGYWGIGLNRGDYQFVRESGGFDVQQLLSSLWAGLCRIAASLKSHKQNFHLTFFKHPNITGEGNKKSLI